MIRCIVLLLILSTSLIPSPQPVIRPEPRVATPPLGGDGDSVDDPAIWEHPTDSAKSLILGTNKKDGIHVYDLSGKEVQIIGRGTLPNNVDILYGFGDPKTPLDLAVVSIRQKDRPGVKIYSFDAESGKLNDVTLDEVLPTFKGKDPYGICSYRSAKSGKGYFFVADKSGKIEQHELFSREGKIGSRLVRSFAVSSQAEGCVCDDEQGVFYLAEEDVGIWRFAAEPDAETKGKLIAKVGEHGLKADVEGLALFCGKDGKGYLIASSQGNNTFKIYRRDGNNEFVRTIDPIAGKFSKPTDTDGIAVTNRALGRVFPKGLFVVQDGNKKDDTKGKQNFLFYAWEEIAGPCSKDDKSDTGLLIDTQWSPRRTR